MFSESTQHSMMQFGSLPKTVVGSFLKKTKVLVLNFYISAYQQRRDLRHTSVFNISFWLTLGSTLLVITSFTTGVPTGDWVSPSSGPFLGLLTVTGFGTQLPQHMGAPLLVLTRAVLPCNPCSLAYIALQRQYFSTELSCLRSHSFLSLLFSQ